MLSVRKRMWIRGLVAALAMAVGFGCGGPAKKLLSLRVSNQNVPAVIAVGPINVTKASYEGALISKDLELSTQEAFAEPLTQTGVFKDVLILNGSTLAVGGDSEAVIALAKDKGADLLLVGEVKEFNAAIGVPTPKSIYDVNMRIQMQLYNVHTRKLVWKKTDMTRVRRSEWRGEARLREVVENALVPALAAGITSPMVGFVQSANAQLIGKGSPASAEDAAESIFGGAELARLDEELRPRAVAPSRKEHAFAIVIGVEKYRDLPMVDYATRDADMVKAYLVKSLGYPEQNVVVLKDDRVTRSQLAARFERWLPAQVKNHRDAEVFVYYAGHGAPDINTNQSFLVPFDGDPSFLETTGYPLSNLYKLLSELPAKRVVVALDTCFSGSGGRSVIAKGTRPMLITVDNPVVSSKNMVVFSATGPNQISSAYREKRHGLFTYHFLKGIQGEADSNNDGTVDIGELGTYIRVGVQTVARRMNVEQDPQVLPGQDLLGAMGKEAVAVLK